MRTALFPHPPFRLVLRPILRSHFFHQIWLLGASGALVLLLAACGGSAASAGSTGSAGSAGPSPNGGEGGSVRHIVIVMEENKNYSEVIGSPDAPFINQLAGQHSLAAAYFGVSPASLPNYFMLTVGDQITPTDLFTGIVNNDNIVRELTNAGKTWKVYAEDLPSVGYLGGNTGNYLKRHNPFVYFSDVQNNPSQQSNVVPFTQFAKDLANNALPNYAFVVPNMIDDGHSCASSIPQCTDSIEVQNTDNWLRTNIAPLLGNSSFSNGLLAIVWDSGDVDFSNGGGKVPLILAGTGVKTGFISTVFYQHASLLRLSMEHLQLSPNLGAAATAPDMSDMVPSP